MEEKLPGIHPLVALSQDQRGRKRPSPFWCSQDPVAVEVGSTSQTLSSSFQSSLTPSALESSVRQRHRAPETQSSNSEHLSLLSVLAFC